MEVVRFHSHTALFYLRELVSLKFAYEIESEIRTERKQEKEKHNVHMKTWLNTDEGQGGGVAQ